MVAVLENLIFKHRIAVLVVLALVTAVMGYYASQLRMDAGFAKQLPRDHEYIKTFFEYQDRLFGSNRVMIVLRAREGDIWSQAFLSKFQALTDEVFFLPGVDRRTVSSLWTPNTLYFEITEEGMEADLVISSDVMPDRMSEEDIALVRDNTIKGGFVGRLVSRDYTAAMVTAELLEVDPKTEKRLDYLDLAARLEKRHPGEVLGRGLRDPHPRLRDPHGGDRGRGAQRGGLLRPGLPADGRGGVLLLALVDPDLPAALLLLTSVVWQFAVIHLLGFGLDPLAILVPFLVFAIGVSHGVQQINLISKQVCSGADSMTAARTSFRGLLVPGSMALITDLIGFGTLIIIPIAMIQELGITAMIGVAFKIITNLIMLPVLASFFTFDEGYVAPGDPGTGGAGEVPASPGQARRAEVRRSGPPSPSR